MEVSRGANIVGMSMLPPDVCPLSLLIYKKKVTFILFLLISKQIELTYVKLTENNLIVGKWILLHNSFSFCVFLFISCLVLFISHKSVYEINKKIIALVYLYHVKIIITQKVIIKIEYEKFV